MQIYINGKAARQNGDNMDRFSIAVAQSGGPTAAVNSSLAGVFRAASLCPAIDNIYGAINGIEGMIGDELADLRRIITSDEDISLLRTTPSTLLGSCRYKLPPKEQSGNDYIKIVNTLDKHNIKALFYIGGIGSMDAVVKLDEYFRAVGKDIRVIGIPKSSDNDIPVTDHCPGFGSAAKYAAATIQEITRDSRVYSTQSITVIETMGSRTGWLAASSCTLHANGESAPHLIYIPEAGFSDEKYLHDTAEMVKHYRAVITAVSEGVCGSEKSAAEHLERITAERFGCKVRSVKLNVMQRCSSHISSLTDLDEAYDIGAAALDAANRGESGVMMAFRRIPGEQYRIEIFTEPAVNCVGKIKHFPAEWINESKNGVTAEAVDYFLPLIKGEPVIRYENGIPVHFRATQ